MRLELKLRAAAAAALVLFVAKAAAAQPPQLRLEPYSFRLADGSDLAAERGRFTVPEDRGDPRSRRIEVGFVRFRSTSPNPGAPIVYLAGGPGGSGVAAARGPRQPVFLALRRVADVIALDQRGVGLSNHIPACTAQAPLDPASVLSEASLGAYYMQTLRDCVGRWRSAGVAIGGYDTEQSADDLEDLRRALGVPKIDLWGISYGTHLAMATMRRHPRSIGRVVLASAEGMDQTVKLPAHVDSAFARIEAAAGAPITALMRRVHARFDREPQTFAFTGRDGARLSFRADSFPLRMMAGIVPKNPDGIPQLAAAYGALDAGQTGPVAPLIWDYFFARPLTMSGMPELMDISSGISNRRLALVRRQERTSLLGTAVNFPMPQLRGAVGGLDLGNRFRREIRSAHPVLLLAGDLDVRTPLEEQAAATAGLSNLRRVVVRNGGHDLFEAHPQVPALLVAFFSGRPVAAGELSLPRPRLSAP
jgi:pimeloyl-ACP methyl ester carboxylesterase